MTPDLQKPMALGASSSDGLHPTVLARAPTPPDPSSGLPLKIQAAWLGLVCAALLVMTAVALRSFFGDPPKGAGPAAEPTTSAAASGAPPSTVAVVASGTPTSATIGPSLGIGPGGLTPSAPPGFGALEARDRMQRNVQLKRIGPFLDDLEALMQAEPSSVDRPDVRRLVLQAALSALLLSPRDATSADAKRLFTIVCEKMGTAGPDILFELATAHGGTRAYTYANELLADPKVLARGTPALQVAQLLRAATTCDARIALLPRVKAEGDGRARIGLFAIAKCGKGPTDCCLANDPQYKEALAAVNTRK